MTKRISKLDEKIFLSIYNMPRYKEEISNLIYGKETKQIYPLIKKMLEYNWIIELEYGKDFTYDTKTNSIEFKVARLKGFKFPVGDIGKRAKQRKYLYGTIKPIFDRLAPEFEKKLERKLSKDEEKRLKKFIDSDSFRILATADPRYLDIDTMLEWMSFQISLKFIESNFYYDVYGQDRKKSDKIINIFDVLGTDLMRLWVKLEPFTNATQFLNGSMEHFGIVVKMIFDDFVNRPKKEQDAIRENIHEWYEKFKGDTMKNVKVEKKGDYRKVSLKIRKKD